MAEPSDSPGVSDLKRLVADLLALVVLAQMGAAQQGPAAFDCRALAEAVEVDGNLAEWDRANARFVPLSCVEPLPSQKDLSASVAASFDRDALYLALHVQDERIVADTTNFWDSDGVDVYFEVGEGATPRRFRLCLLPFNEGRKFGVVTWEGRRVLGPGGLNGVEAVARELGEGSGAYGIEARIPLHPFGVDPLAAAPIRVDVAIRDHDAPDKSVTDAEPPESATLSLSGRKNLAGGGAELPRLSFVGNLKRDLAARPEASTSVGRTALVGALVAIALVIFVGLSARSVQRALLPQLPRWKRIAWPALAAIALLLAAVGIHGLLAYTVAQRSQEIGVRLALGAEPWSVARMILSDGMRLALVGIALGVPGAYAAARGMSALLFGVQPGDPVTIGTAIGVALLMTFAGALVPALRALRLSPLVALRTE